MGPAVDDAYAERAAQLAGLAAAAADAKRWADAESLARRALALDPGSSQARVTLGRAHEAGARYAEAATDFVAASRSDTPAPEAVASLLRIWGAPVAIFGVVAVVAREVLRAVVGHFSPMMVLLGLVALAVALLVVTAIAVARRRHRFRALTAEDRRFVESLERKRGWTSPDRVALLTVTAVLAVLVAGTVTFVAGTKPSTALRPGDCFTADGISSIQNVSTTACELPHATEIYAAFTDPSPPGAAYPGIAALHASTFARCVPPFEALVGVRYNSQRALTIHTLVPEADYWAAGIRDTWCGVRRLDGSQLIGKVGRTTGPTPAAPASASPSSK